jgi:hypothetical protein
MVPSIISGNIQDVRSITTLPLCIKAASFPVGFGKKSFGAMLSRVPFFDRAELSTTLIIGSSYKLVSE